MSKTNDGGPAWPTVEATTDSHGRTFTKCGAKGMSLRAWFAGQVLPVLAEEMAGRMTEIWAGDPDMDGERTGFDDRCALFYDAASTGNTYADVVAQEAVILADALIAALADGGAA